MISDYVCPECGNKLVEIKNEFRTEFICSKCNFRKTIEIIY